jgi:hypothetical protein
MFSKFSESRIVRPNELCKLSVALDKHLTELLPANSTELATMRSIGYGVISCCTRSANASHDPN